MANDNEVIRRGDATAICQEARESGEADMRSIIAAIAALPADDRVAKLVEAAKAVLDDQRAGRAAIRDDVSLRLHAALAAWEAGK